MNKKLKLILVTGVAAFVIVTWALIYFSHTVAKPVNNWWQVAMGLSARRGSPRRRDESLPAPTR